MKSLAESNLEEINSDSVVRNERIYLHIYDYETKEFSGLTTYHGLVRIYNSNTWPSRIFWCVVVISCLSMFMTHSGILLWSYHLKPTLTQVTAVVPNGGILFPDLTLCNYNLVMSSKLLKWDMSHDVLQYVMKAYKQKFIIDDSKLAKEHESFVSYAKKFERMNRRPFDFLEFFNSTGYGCHDLIKACWWSGTPVHDCCIDTESVITDHGKCIRFSNKKFRRRQWLSGSDHGWEILVDVKNYERVDNISGEFLYSEFGVRLLVHDHDDFPILSSYGISVPTGKKLYAGLELKNVSLLPKTDWGSCESKWNPSVHKDVGNLKYSAHHCEAICIQNWMLENCGCVAISKKVTGNVHICTPYELHQCQLQGANLMPKNCTCNVECSRMEYRIQASYSDLLHSTYDGNNLMADKTSRRIQDYVKLVVYFREMSYENHEQHRQIQTADLLSSIAGSMGLFLGMSTVTLLEIFIYLFKSMWGTINTERQRQFVRAMIEGEKRQNEMVIVKEEEPNIASRKSSSMEEDERSVTTSGSAAGDFVVVQESNLVNAISSTNKSVNHSSYEEPRPRRRALTIVVQPESRYDRSPLRRQRRLPIATRSRRASFRLPRANLGTSNPSEPATPRSPFLSPRGSFELDMPPSLPSRKNSRLLPSSKRSEPLNQCLQRADGDVHVHINRHPMRRASSHYVDYLI